MSAAPQYDPAPFGPCAFNDNCAAPAVFSGKDARRERDVVVCEQHLHAHGRVAFAPYLGQQTKFFQRRERIVFYGGAGGGGKSLCGMMKFTQQLDLEARRYRSARRRGVSHNSHCHGIYFRRGTPDLRQAISRSFEYFPLIDDTAFFTQQSGIWTFPKCGGAKFQFSHMEHEDDRFNHKSNEYTYIFFDELTEFEEIQYDYLDTRLRTDDAELDPLLQICAASNPDGRGLVWVRERFIEVVPPETVIRIETEISDGRVIQYDQVFIPAKLSDNPKLMASGRYEASLMNKRPEVREAILRGNWYIAPGAYLAEVWDSDQHICEDHDPPPGARIFRSGDWGIRTPFSFGWWYEDADGCLTLIRALRGKRLTVEKVAAKIRLIEMEMGLWDEDTDQSRLNFTRSPLDSACFHDSGMTGSPTVAKDFAKKGIRWVRAKKGPGSRYNGAAQIVGRMSTYIETAFEGAKTATMRERPMLRAMKGAAASWGKTMPVLRADPNDANDVDTKADDHDWDMTMYACLENPIAMLPEDDEDQDLEEIDEEISRRRGGTNRLGAGPWTHQ